MMCPIHWVLVMVSLLSSVESRFSSGQNLVPIESVSTSTTSTKKEFLPLHVAGGAAKKYMTARKMETLQ